MHQDIKSPGLLRTKKSRKVVFVLESIYKKGGVFKYPKAFQHDNGSEFTSEVIKWLEKHNVENQRATAKYKHTHTAFAEAFNKELAKLLFKPIVVKWVLKCFKTLRKYRQKFEQDPEQDEQYRNQR